MLSLNRLVAGIGIAALAAVGGPLAASTRKGDRFLAEGRKHEAVREWDAALESYQQALATDTTEMVYQMAVSKARFQAGAVHVDLALKLRTQGQPEEAVAEFQKALAIDPSSAVAGQELKVTQEMIRRERRKVLETGVPSPPEERGMTPLELARKQAQERIDRILPPKQLMPTNPLPKTIKLKGQTAKVLFETVAKVAGINVVWDPAYQNPARNSLNLDLENSTVEQALDDIALMTRSSWKPLSADTIFISNDSGQ
jgi:general secretion pathway protein D